MRISHKLALLTILPLALLLMVGTIAATTYRALNQGREASRIASILETQVFALGTLTYDYLHQREERAREQWLQVYTDLGQTINQAQTLAFTQATATRLRAEHLAMGELFHLLAAQPRPGQDIPEPLAAERESWRVTRLLLYTQSAFSNAMALRERAEQSNERRQEFFFAAMVILLTLAAAFVALLTWWTSTGIRASLLRLRHAAEIIAAGNLDYRADTGTRDEHAELAQALNTMAQNLKTLQTQMIQSEKLAAVGTLAAGVAHELNNPLMGVMGYVNHSRKLVQEPEPRHLLGEAEGELDRMRDLLKSMLGFAGPVDERRVEVRVPIVLERALALLRQDFEAQGITVTTVIAPDLPTITAKEGHLQQVFINLLMNARDALVHRPEKNVRISAWHNNGVLRVDVADTGIGIPEALQERIFEPFFTTKGAGQGTGLGLSIARNLIVNMKGTLRCESRVGEGATFIVELPLT